MGYNFDGKTTPELWAVIDINGNVLYSRGGSSTTPRLMVYPTEKNAMGAIKNPWIQQILPSVDDFRIVRVYAAAERGQG